MLKLIVAFIWLGTAAARPGLMGTDGSLKAMGTVIRHIPTTITHHSQTQIHSSFLAPSITSIRLPSIVRPLLVSQVLPAKNTQEQMQGQTLSNGTEVAREQGQLSSDNQQFSQDQLSSGQSQTDREQRIRTLSSLKRNQQELQKQVISGQSQIDREQRLLSLNGNQQEFQTPTLSGQSQINRDQRLFTLSSQNRNQHVLQKQMPSGQRRLIEEQQLSGKPSVAGNEEALSMDRNDPVSANQRNGPKSDNIMAMQQVIGNGALSLNAHALIGRTGAMSDSINIGLRLGGLKH